jgi:hypothetical protein
VLPLAEIFEAKNYASIKLITAVLGATATSQTEILAAVNCH